MEDLALQYSPETRQAVKNWFEKYKSRQGTDIYNIAEAYLDSQLTNFGEMTFALDEEEYRAYSKHLLAEDGHSIDEYILLFEDELIEEANKVIDNPTEFAKFFPTTNRMISELNEVAGGYVDTPAKVASNILWGKIV
tara:strand:+ start:91 stop:501 length:411 start_codon:yes stop_codon:yes gene_type:complete